ncbi:hypothetical protein ACJX0J_027028, partial [Zea mays]
MCDNVHLAINTISDLLVIVISLVLIDQVKSSLSLLFLYVYSCHLCILLRVISVSTGGRCRVRIGGTVAAKGEDDNFLSNGVESSRGDGFVDTVMQATQAENILLEEVALSKKKKRDTTENHLYIQKALIFLIYR